jgi:hypothetical protein
MPSRSSRSRPASRISCRELTGSASRAIATDETLTTGVYGERDPHQSLRTPK